MAASRSQIIEYCRGLANSGGRVDADGVYNAQCVDLPNMIAIKFFGSRLPGNGIDMSNSARNNGWKVYTSGTIKAGAITTISIPGSPYGHTGVCVEDEVNGSSLHVEQNYGGGGAGLVPARYVRRNRSQHGETILSWFYPPYTDGIDGIIAGASGGVSAGSLNIVNNFIGGDTINFCFNIKNDTAWNPGTMFYYNGAINKIQGIHNEEELKYLTSIYKETTGMSLKSYGWDAKVAPVYVRLFGTLQPGSDQKAIQDALAKIMKEVQEAIT